jgi:hypothetical protein
MCAIVKILISNSHTDASNPYFFLLPPGRNFPTHTNALNVLSRAARGLLEVQGARGIYFAVCVFERSII